MSTQDLKAAQLIPGHSNGLGRIERKNTHLLKLPHHRGSKEGDRCADSRDNGLERLARVGSVGQRWLGLFHVNAQFKGVEDLHLVPMSGGGFTEATGAIGFGISGQDGDFHLKIFPRLTVQRIFSGGINKEITLQGPSTQEGPTQHVLSAHQTEFDRFHDRSNFHLDQNH